MENEILAAVQQAVADFIGATFPEAPPLAIRLTTEGLTEPDEPGSLTLSVNDSDLMNAEPFEYEARLRLRAFQELQRMIGNGDGSVEVAAVISDLQASLGEPEDDGAQVAGSFNTATGALTTASQPVHFTYLPPDADGGDAVELQS